MKALVFCLGLLGAVAFASLALMPPRAQAERKGHGSITAQLECSACHSTEGWRLMDIEPGEGFDHDATGFPLRARHERAACTQCHQQGRTITRECRGCHEDVHRGRLGDDCSSCHGSDSFLHTRAIEMHRQTRLPLTGMHAIIDCSQCHLRSADRPFAAVRADCYACHADDYRRPDIHPVHMGAADGSTLPFDRNCAACHRATGWSPAILPVSSIAQALTQKRDERFAHDLRFPISFGSHRNAQCGDCHLRPEGRGPVRCVGCHAHREGQLRNQHDGQVPPDAAGACLSCHVRGARL